MQTILIYYKMNENYSHQFQSDWGNIMASTEITSMFNCGLIAALAALCLYLASSRQRLWPAARARAYFLRWLSVPLLTGALATVAEAAGFWAGLVIVLISMAAVLLVVPSIDLWLQRGKPQRA